MIVHGTVLGVYNKSVLIKEKLSSQDIFIPLSKIRKWGPSGYGDCEYSADELSDSELSVWIDIPSWLARREFLL